MAVVLLTRAAFCAAARDERRRLGGLSFLFLLALMALRMPIGLAMFAVGAVGYVDPDRRRHLTLAG